MKVVLQNKLTRLEVNPQIYKDQKGLNMRIDLNELRIVVMKSRSEKEEEHTKVILEGKGLMMIGLDYLQ